MNTCSICGCNQIPPKPSPEKTTVRHGVNNQLVYDVVIPYDDAFFEIISGDRKGGLVHRWDIIK